MINRYRDGEITSGQLYIMIVSIMIGTGVLGLSRAIAEFAQQDAWISVIINGIIISLTTAMAIYVAQKHPEMNFIQYTAKLLSKPIAYLILFTYSVYAVLSTGLIIRFLSDMVGTWFLPRTPTIIVTFIIIASTVYIVKDGLTLVGRFNEIIVLSILSFIILIFPSLSKASVLNLMPVGGSGVVNILKGVLPSYYSFAGFEIVLLFYPLVSNKNPKILKYSVFSILFVTLFYTITVASQIALFGYIEIKDILYVSINYLDVLDTPVIERIEIFFAIFWTFSVFGTISIQYIAASIGLQSIFNTKKTSFFTYLFAPLIFIIALLPRNTVEVAAYSDILGKITIFFGIIIPVLLYIMYHLRGGKMKNEKA